jgi:hypothetical protein
MKIASMFCVLALLTALVPYSLLGRGTKSPTQQGGAVDDVRAWEWPNPFCWQGLTSEVPVQVRCPIPDPVGYDPFGRPAMP